ncbi:toprim domain-containing protein [Streptosporangium sp. NPDC020072]|uniref:toprim domain-containing protein n=1 Tax=Streptosporangium sp. NPDC020072 TaxID=3154788 RepID=UPI00343D4C46
MPVPSSERRTFLEKARKRYQADLLEDAFAVDYLTTSRYMEWDNVTYFRLGVVGNPLPGHEAYKGMLSIPYMAPDGDTLDIRFKRLVGDGPKYLTTPGSKPRPFNTSAIEAHSDVMVLQEGEFDTMTWRQCGVPAIGVPGVDSWRPEWALIFKPYRSVIVPMDGDEPGRKFGATIAKALSNAHPVDLGDGMDSNDFYGQYGKDALLEKVGL